MSAAASLATELSPAEDRLPNGLRVIVRSRPSSRQFGAALSFGAGHLDEPRGKPSLAHLAEHLAFAGPTVDLVDRASRAGAYVNAYTAGDRTAFVAAAHAELEPLLLEILSRMLVHDSPPEQQLRHEQGILAQELWPLDPWDAAGERFSNRLLGDRNWNLRADGLLKRINRISAADVTQFRRQHLSPFNACLAVVTPRGEAEVREEIRRLFSVEWPEAPVPREACPPPNAQAGVTCTPFRSPKCVVAVWTRDACTDWATAIVARMASSALGGGPHSRLYRELRERRGLAYFIDSSDNRVGQLSTIVSTAYVGRSAAVTTAGIILDEIARLRGELLDEEGFASTKRRLRREFEVFTENALELAQFLSSGGVRDPHEQPGDGAYLASLEALTLEEAQSILARLLDPAAICTHVIGGINPLRRALLRRAVRRRNRKEPPRA